MCCASLITIFTLSVSLTSVKSDYWSDRDKFITEELALMIGSDIQLKGAEKVVNQYLMTHKINEYEQGFRDPEKFTPSRHFFNSKKDIEESKVFKLIKKLPKGAVLHAHDTSLASTEVLLNLTYTENLYTCRNKYGKLNFKFFKKGSTDDSCKWNLLKDLRENNPQIDDEIRKQMSLVVDDPLVKYPDGNVAWKAFRNIFATVTPILTYRLVWEKYLYAALEELYEDGVWYIEIRTTLPSLYDLEGNLYSSEDVVGLFKEVVEKFTQTHENFKGARIIYGPPRAVGNTTMDSYIKTAENLKKLYPNFVEGFDLVGQEDLGQPLSKFIPELLNLKALNISFFFHAGETKWYGSSTDENLIDAVLLGTKRIGHGYALAKHPKVLEEIKARNIAIEVSPISNQVLKLVDDMRNHPAAAYIASGYPVVISNDDPSFWGAKGLSYDWYMAFMALGGEKADLRFLKQLALNSFIYSGMAKTEKTEAIKSWETYWMNLMHGLALKISNNHPRIIFYSGNKIN